MTPGAVEAAELEGALASLAPSGVRTGAAPVDEANVDDLFRQEAASIANAVTSRRSEFASGRALARRLIGKRLPLPVGADRAPEWPGGLVGSIAHDRRVVVAAVAHVDELSGVGVDIEAMGAMTPDEAALVLRDDEEELDPRLAFVLKEAVYKAWSPSGGRVLEFHDVRLRLERDGAFTGEVVADGIEIAGRYTAAAGRWLALASRPANGAA